MDPERVKHELRRLRKATEAAWAETRSLAGVLAGRVAPFAGHAAVSAVTFGGSLGAVQAGAYFCRLSCSTPIAAPLVGALGVGAASAAAGQASAALGRWRREGKPLFQADSWAGAVQVEDLVLDALLGCALFVVRVRM